VPLRPAAFSWLNDDHGIRQLYADVLARSGYHVDTADNGASGWRALNASYYDLLITDNTMPGVTGLELIKKLRSEEHAAAGHPGVGNGAGGGVEPVSRGCNLTLCSQSLSPSKSLLETVRAVLRATDRRPRLFSRAWTGKASHRLMVFRL